MLEWYVVAGIVGIRVLFNGGLTALVAKSGSPTSRAAICAAVLTALSAGLTAGVLLGVLGLAASYLESLLQVALVVLTGYVVRSNPSPGRVRATIAISLCALALLLLVIPVYGDALVAP
jgi:hypothetical protein